ncbi:MAG: HAD-IB family hydrolase [Steroidobacter sp.]
MRVPRAYAFFDVDDTLITIKSLLHFQEYWYQWANDQAGRKAYMEEIQELLAQDAPWEYVNRRYYAHFEGRSVADVERCVQAWFAEVQRSLQQKRQSLFHSAVMDRLQSHRREDVEPVFVSGSFVLLLQPIAERLQVQHVLAIRQQVVDGVFTGHILPPQTIGQGKADAVLEFLRERKVNPASCYAYGDDISDVPMLSCVGFPFVVRGGRRLEAHAEQQGWPVMDPC